MAALTLVASHSSALSRAGRIGNRLAKPEMSKTSRTLGLSAQSASRPPAAATRLPVTSSTRSPALVTKSSRAQSTRISLRPCETGASSAFSSWGAERVSSWPESATTSTLPSSLLWTSKGMAR